VKNYLNAQNIRYITGIGLIFLSVNNYNFITFSTQNIFFGSALFILFLEKQYIKSLHIKIIITYFVIFLLRIYFINSSTQDEETSFLKLILQHVKFIVFIIFFSGFSNSKQIEGLLKWLFISVLLASVIGLLIHFVGEPFASFRMQFLEHADVEVPYFSKGDRIVGLDTQIFSFAYPVVIGPILALIFYLNKHKSIYLIFFFICLLTVLLNAERSSLGAVLFASSVIAYKFINIRKNLAVIFFMFLGVLAFNWFIQNKISTDTANGFNRFTTQEEGADDSRIGKQLAAVVVTLRTPFQGGNYSEYEELCNRWFGAIPTYPHNSYINIGFQLGVTAWIFVFIGFFAVYRSIKICNKKIDKTTSFRYYYFGITICLIALFIVALFHNKGPFNGDFISVFLIGLVLAPLNPKFEII